MSVAPQIKLPKARYENTIKNQRWNWYAWRICCLKTLLTNSKLIVKKVIMISLGSRTNAVFAGFLNTVAEKSDRPETALKTHMVAMKHYFTAISIPFQSEELINVSKALKCETNRPAVGQK